MLQENHNFYGNGAQHHKTEDLCAKKDNSKRCLFQIIYINIITTVITFILRFVNLIGRERSSDRIDLHFIF